MHLHKDFFIYCIFGAMATLVNMLSYELLYAHLGLPNTPAVALAWFFAVTFAFFTDVLDLNHTLWKFISNLAMGICNYLAGRLFIFAKEK